MYNSLYFMKIITGFSKTLNIANQLLPMVKQIKPIINNGNKILESINNHKENISNLFNKDTEVKKVNNHLPTFFQ